MEPPDPLEALRRHLGGRFRRLISGSSELPAWRVGVGDPGLFGPDSATWRVHSSPAMLVGGLRALLLQTLHPLAMAAVAQHSNYRDDPWGRLHRTAAFVSLTTFGPTAEALAAIEVVRRVHERVSGVTDDGRPYTATDPHLLKWVHLTEVDSFLRAYMRFGHRWVPKARQDAYVHEMCAVAERLGVIDAPRSRAELREQYDSYRPELEATALARDAVRFLLNPPGNLAFKGSYAVIASAAVALLPSEVRTSLGLVLLPGSDRLVIRPAAQLLLDGLGWVMQPD